MRRGAAWSGPYTTALGSHINSPKARYLQWKAVLTGANGASPVLTSVSAAYLPRNTRPVVDSVTVHPAGVVFQRPFPTGDPELAGLDGAADPRAAVPGTPTVGQTLGRRTFQKSLQTFVWSARDTDGDRLQFALAYRREGERNWTLLKDGLDDDVFTWDTTTVPDGTYVIKVTASDGAANAPAMALQGERESQSFEIDNTPPTVTVAPAAAGAAPGTIRFTVQDTQTPIQRVDTRAPAIAGARRIRPTGCSIPARSTSSWCWGPARSRRSWCARRTASATSRRRFCGRSAAHCCPLPTSNSQLPTCLVRGQQDFLGVGRWELGVDVVQTPPRRRQIFPVRLAADRGLLEQPDQVDGDRRAVALRRAEARRRHRAHHPPLELVVFPGRQERGLGDDPFLRQHAGDGERGRMRRRRGRQSFEEVDMVVVDPRQFHPLVQAERVAVRAGRRHRLEQPGERVVPLRRREVEQPGNRRDARHRRAHRAQAGVDEVQVLERARELDRPGRLALAADLAHHRLRHRLEVARQLGFEARVADQRRAHHLAHLAQLAGGGVAGGAQLQVVLDAHLLGDVQLAVVQRLEEIDHRRAHHRVPHGRPPSRRVASTASIGEPACAGVSRSCSRSNSRARARRDFTVPTATPCENAISS